MQAVSVYYMMLSRKSLAHPRSKFGRRALAGPDVTPASLFVRQLAGNQHIAMEISPSS